MTDACPDCGLTPNQEGNPSGARVCTACGKGIWVPNAKIGKPRPGWMDCGFCDSPSEHAMHTRITELESKLDALIWRRDGVPTEVGRVYALYHPSWGGTLITCKGDETPNTNGVMWLGPLPEPPK